MRHIRALTMTALVASGAAFAQSQPGDAMFCQQYAEIATTAAQDAIARNPACLSFSTGVHDNRDDHLRWCARTPRESVEGASRNIRRLTSRCTNGALAAANEYSGYDIVGSETAERPYGRARQWEVKAAFSGRTFMYCVAQSDTGNRSVRFGYDLAMPGEGGQWQLAVPVRGRKDWQGRLEIDGRAPGNRAGADVSGTAVGAWSIAWLNIGQVDALRNGRQAVLGVGKQDFDFDLSGIAAAITKIEECRDRRGAPGAVNPGRQNSVLPAPQSTAGLEPADLVASIYRNAMAGRDIFEARTRAQVLSLTLIRLIAKDEQDSARRKEPGKLDYSLLTGGQDQLKIGDLNVAEVSRQQDRASVRVRFRNTAFKGRAPVETVMYQVQAGEHGWRIVNIVYNDQHNLLATLTR